MSQTKRLYLVTYTEGGDATDAHLLKYIAMFPCLEGFVLGERVGYAHYVFGLKCVIWEMERTVSVPVDLLVVFDGLGDGGEPEFVALFEQHMRYWRAQELLNVDVHQATAYAPAGALYGFGFETTEPIVDLARQACALTIPVLEDLHVVMDDNNTYIAAGEPVRFVMTDEQFEVGAFANYPLVVTMTLRDGLRVQLKQDWGGDGHIEHFVTPEPGREPHHFAEWGNPVLLKEVTIPADHPLRKYFVLGEAPDL